IHRYFIFDVRLDPMQSKRFYMRIESRDTLQLPLNIWNPKAYRQHDHNEQYLFGIYYGIMLVMIIYNSFLFVTLRDEPTFYYIAFLFCFVGAQMSLNGYLQEYISPNHPEFSKWFRPMILGLGVAFNAKFARLYLRTDIYSPKLHKALGMVSWFSLLTIFTTLMGNFTVSISLTMAGILLCSILMTSAAYIGWRKGFVPAKYYLISYGSFVIAGCATLFRAYGLLPVNFFTEYGVQIGSILIVVLLALGLANRFNQERKDLFDAQKRAFENEALVIKEREKSLKRELVVREEQFLIEQKALKSEAETKAKGDFLASMSHEIRTPMNGVIGIAELIGKTPLNQQQVDYVNIIKASGQSLLTIINDILDFSKIDAGEMCLEKIDINFKQMISDIETLFSVSATKDNIIFSVNYLGDVPPFVKGDPTRLRQILTNFLSNAFKFTESGSILLQIEKMDKDDFYKFSVKDSGIGLSKEGMKKIFKNYVQADSDTSRKYGGTGLGLAICKKLTELMGGEIGVESKEGKGSTFWFSAKLTHGKPIKSIEQITEYDIEKLQNKNALIIEDNNVNQLVIKKMLKSMGINYEIAENGLLGLKAFQNGNFDIILMDCEMPVMNGYEATKEIRSHETNNSMLPIPIVALTANALPEQQEKCIKSGMNSHLSKPLVLTALQKSLIQNLL
ncbi:MAG: response regulator, partial [Pseudomonadales bacterium]|nr:response regulator [Pseudomonadales bacterium]